MNPIIITAIILSNAWNARVAGMDGRVWPLSDKLIFPVAGGLIMAGVGYPLIGALMVVGLIVGRKPKVGMYVVKPEHFFQRSALNLRPGYKFLDKLVGSFKNGENYNRWLRQQKLACALRGLFYFPGHLIAAAITSPYVALIGLVCCLLHGPAYWIPSWFSNRYPTKFRDHNAVSESLVIGIMTIPYIIACVI